jgi:hypothetical protein
LATLATKDTLATVDTKEEKEEPRPGGAAQKLDSAEKGVSSGFQKFKAGMAKRQCCLCGRSFPYDLTPYTGGGQRGYICTTCHMHGPPVEPAKADSQTKLEAGA